MNITLGAVILLILSACQPAVDVEAESRDLMETDRAFAGMAVEQGTAEAFRNFFEAEGIQFPNGLEPFRGREAVYQSLLDVPEDYILIWEPELAEVAASGDLGWTWGYYTATYTDSTETAIKNFGKYLTVWRKQKDGTWRVRADIGNKNPDPKTGD